MSDPDLPGYFPEPIRLPEPPGGFAPSRRRSRPGAAAGGLQTVRGPDGGPRPP